MSQAEIKKIYDNAMIKRSQNQKDFAKRQQEEIENNFWKYAYTRIENILKGVMEMYQTPSYSKSDIDKAQKEFSEFLDMVNMNTIPEVIDELILREIKSKFLEKIKTEDSGDKN